MDTYLVQVDHTVAPEATGSFDILQGQGEVDALRVGDIDVVGVVLVPLLHGSKHLALVRADDVHVLRKRGGRERERERGRRGEKGSEEQEGRREGEKS